MYEPSNLLFFGAFGMIIIYNLGYLILLRSATYASYFMFHTCLVAIMLFYTGFIEDPWFDVTLHGVPAGVFFLAVIFFLAFSRDFLEPKTLSPKIEGYFNKSIVLNSGFLLLFAFSANSTLLENIVVAVLMVEICLLLLFAAYLGMNGNVYARYYLVSFSFLLGALFTASLGYIGLADLPDTLPHLFEAGILVEAGGLSFAMAYKQKASDIRLRQNELLFRELSHRVQNNLQQITSILTIQMRAVDDAALKAHLEEAINRIGSISLIHKMLHNASLPGSVNMETYFKAFLEGYRGLNPSVNFHVKCAPEIELGIDRLTPLALIVNELITNSVKHGLKSIEDAHIHIALEERNGMLFTYDDNGTGYDEETSTDASLGTKLIRLLSTSQLKGEMRIDTEGSYSYTLHFSK